MMTIRETINNELGGNRYSYIELYDIDTEMLIYKGVVWDCPYDMSYIVRDFQVYNINNKVCFTMWIDFTIWEVENDNIIIPYDETAELHNTPIGEMTTSEFIKWLESFDRQ